MTSQTKEAPAELQLRLGAISPKIGEQLKAQRLKADPKEVARWQLISDSISALSLHGYLSVSAASKARQKLVNAVCRGVSR